MFRWFIPVESTELHCDCALAIEILQDRNRLLVGTVVVERAEISNTGQSSAVTWFMPAITVLLADDHAVVRKGLRAFLETQQDMRGVGEAENGRQAVTLAKRLQPDVVLMDISMPLLNGFEATRQLNEAHVRSKVLMLSYHTDNSYVEQIANVGAVGYLVKQSVAQEIITAIREAKKGNPFFSSSISQPTTRTRTQRANTAPSAAERDRSRAVRRNKSSHGRSSRVSAAGSGCRVSWSR